MMTDPSVGRDCIMFTALDVEHFARTSRDLNPLHLDPTVARAGPYGRPPAFGILGALVCLSRLPVRGAGRLTRLTLEFPNAIFTDVAYAIRLVKATEDEATVELRDGRRILVRATATWGPGTPIPMVDTMAAGSPRSEAAERGPDNCTPGTWVEGSYSPERVGLQTLIDRLDLPARGIGPAEVAALLWSSYLVGMELPGRSGLFARLALTFRCQALELPAIWKAHVTDFDERFNRLLARAELGSTVQAEVRVFLRFSTPPEDDLDAYVSPSDNLQGRVTLVIGASRGLGASVARALALQGSTVVGTFLHSAGAATRLAELPLPGSGGLRLVQADGSSPTACTDLLQQILSEHGHLDLLVCNACPPPPPLWLEQESLERISRYVTESLALVATPLVTFLKPLEATRGHCVVISSAVVEGPAVPEWPHYLAAKQAIEGLTHAAAAEVPRAHYTLVRPPKLITDLLSTPLGRQAAIPPAIVAARLVERLAAPGAPGDVALLSWSNHSKRSPFLRI